MPAIASTQSTGSPVESNTSDRLVVAAAAFPRLHTGRRGGEAIAIRCTECGREYDVTLFQYGRTVWCTCGRRVAAETVRRSLGRGADARFLADAMLGRLARWLRILGFDCAYEADVSDEALVRRAIAEDRTILTRDRALPDDWRVAGIHLVRSEGVHEQIVEVLRHFALADSVHLFRRCNRCNARLETVRTCEVADRVPADVLVRQPEVRICHGCGRVYWQGSHTRRMERVAEALLDAT